MKILITGGTGTFGKNFLKFLIQNHKKKLKRIVIYSRDEFKQSELSKIYPESKFPFLRYYIGDIRDSERLKLALQGIDIVIHAAAMKQVPACENDPFEAIKTNIIGAQNVVSSCLQSNTVKRVIALSTDKAAGPINLYGATKLCSDKLFLAADNLKGKQKISFTVVRYGNVMMSRGSVIPLFLDQYKYNRTLNITDSKMTRFNITIDDAVRRVYWCIDNLFGGEVYVPKIPSYNIMDLAKSINNTSSKIKYKIIGIRQGEKIHEELISKGDSYNSLEAKDHYLILNNISKFQKYQKRYKKVPLNFCYSSDNNKSFLSVNQLKELIKSQMINFNI